jgi:hypothetical protein
LQYNRLGSGTIAQQQVIFLIPVYAQVLLY